MSNNKYSKSASLNKLRAEALTIVGILLGILIKWDDFESLYLTDPVNFLLSMLLALFAIIWFYTYYRAGLKEQSWLEKYLGEERVSGLSSDVYAIVFLLAIFFVILVYFSDKVIYYSAILTVIGLIDIWGAYLLKLRIREPLLALMRSHEKNLQTLAAPILHKYYFGYPWQERSSTTMFLNAVFFIVVFCSTVLHLSISKELQVGIYVLLLFTNFASLALHGYWRKVTNNKLLDLEMT